jgi:gluconolactonase
MPLDTSVCLSGLPGLLFLDSLAVDGDGNVCVATIINGGVTVFSPKGEVVEFVATGDLLTTNVCFGGDDLRTAYITLSGTGRLMSMRWPRPGLRLHFT